MDTPLMIPLPDINQPLSSLDIPVIDVWLSQGSFGG